MNIYDEITGEVLTSPDETKGYVYTGQRVARHVPEHDEILEGTDGWRHRIPAHDEYEPCQYYHAYTAEELAERDKPTAEQRLTDVEQRTTALESASDDLVLMIADIIGGEE